MGLHPKMRSGNVLRTCVDSGYAAVLQFNRTKLVKTNCHIQRNKLALTRTQPEVSNVSFGPVIQEHRPTSQLLNAMLKPHISSGSSAIKACTKHTLEPVFRLYLWGVPANLFAPRSSTRGLCKPNLTQAASGSAGVPLLQRRCRRSDRGKSLCNFIPRRVTLPLQSEKFFPPRPCFGRCAEVFLHRISQPHFN